MGLGLNSLSQGFDIFDYNQEYQTLKIYLLDLIMINKYQASKYWIYVLKMIYLKPILQSSK